MAMLEDFKSMQSLENTTTWNDRCVESYGTKTAVPNAAWLVLASQTHKSSSNDARIEMDTQKGSTGRGRAEAY